MQPNPNLFSEIHKELFRPLAGVHANLYWQVLYVLYHLDFEDEPFEITKEFALDHISQILETNDEWKTTHDIDEELPADGLYEKDEARQAEGEARIFARRLLKRLQLCGWFDYEYRKEFGYVLNFFDYSARLMHTLAGIARKEQVSFQGLAYGVKASLAQESFQERPGVALETAQKNTVDLVRELKILNRNIHRYVDRIFKDALAADELIRLHMDIYQKQVVEGNYHRFKTSDNIYKFRQFIVDRIDALQKDSALVDAARAWVAENYQMDNETAGKKVREWCELITAQFRSVDRIISDVDRRNARYSGVTLQKINYHLHQDKLLEGQLMTVLEALLNRGISEDTAESISGKLFELYEIEAIAGDSLYTNPKKGAAHQPSDLSLKKMPMQTKDDLLKRHQQEMDRRFTRKKIYQFAVELLGNRLSISLDEVPVEDDHQFIRMIYLLSYSNDSSSPYSVELKRDEWVWKSGYGFRPGRIIRKR